MSFAEPRHLLAEPRYTRDPDPVPMCKCGVASPLPGYDECAECLYAFYLANPDEFDDACDNPRLQSPDEQAVYSRVSRERVRRFAAGEAVYPQIGSAG